MGRMLLDYFSTIKSWDVESKRNTKSGTWLQNMCPYTSKKKLKPFTKSSRTKQSCKSSNTILKKKHSEQAKVEINASQSKATFVFRWKSSTKRGISTSTSGWKKQRTHVVSSNGVIGVLGTSTHIAWTYSLAGARACAQHNCANRGGVGSNVNSKHLRKTKTSVF